MYKLFNRFQPFFSSHILLYHATFKNVPESIKKGLHNVDPETLYKQIKWLKKYLASFKERGEFHEQCIQDIFETISIKYSSNSLEVAGRFMRRGGIDINPIRSNKKRIQFKNFRFFNQ